MFLLLCPHCKNRMKYQPTKTAAKAGLAGLRKACVYCGKSFVVKSNIIKQV